jgi:carbonic anhydrase
VVKKQKLPVFVIGLAAAMAAAMFVLCGCAGAPAQPRDASHWSYTGNTGPAYWYKLSPEYSAAKYGKFQSPVNIDASAPAAPAGMGKPEIVYQKTPFKVENNGHTIELIPETDENHIILDGEKYRLSQFHFHAPSEHTINGGQFPMEIHLVHHNAQGNIAVIGFVVTEGTENGTLKEAFDTLPRKPAHGEAGEPETEIDLSGLFAGENGAYRYDGSLTTPPCTEGVKWIVFAVPVEMSAAQIGAFKEIYSGNARPVQKLNGRSVYFVTD